MKVWLLVFIGTPPYVIYDLPRIAHGEVGLFRWVMFLLAVLLIGIFVVRLGKSRGDEYVRARAPLEKAAALFMLILGSPMLLFFAALIKLETPGAALYSQERIGKNRRKRDRRRIAADALTSYPMPDCRKAERRQRDLGGKPFIIYKLRSMKVNAEQQTGIAWSTGDDDPRVTKVGYYIRKLHIDEFPQFYNVLRGQMSIVGPRPERAAFIEELSHSVNSYRNRLNAPPGITG